MSRLSFIELSALMFTGVAGLGSAVQAYVSWETRGEVARAIVFAQRIDACSELMSAIEPFAAKARPEGRAMVARGAAEAQYSLPQLYYTMSSGNAAFEAAHGQHIDKWRIAAAAFKIVSTEGSEDRLAYFDNVITREISEGTFMTQSEMLIWLERLESETDKLVKSCRGLAY